MIDWNAELDRYWFLPNGIERAASMSALMHRMGDDAAAARWAAVADRLAEVARIDERTEQ